MSQLLSVKLLKGDLISAQNKLNEINEFFESKKNNEDDLSKSLLIRNFGYAWIWHGYDSDITRIRTKIHEYTSAGVDPQRE